MSRTSGRRVIVHRAALVAAIALTACGADKVVAPASAYCTPPAPISNTRDPGVKNIFVNFKPGVNGSTESASLIKQLNFTLLWAPTDFSGFVAALTDSQIASVQCDPAVMSLEWDDGGGLDSRVPKPR
jgi:hypothetical protein